MDGSWSASGLSPLIVKIYLRRFTGGSRPGIGKTRDFNLALWPDFDQQSLRPARWPRLGEINTNRPHPMNHEDRFAVEASPYFARHRSNGRLYNRRSR